ncbi:MAG: hypothetical protein EPO08_21405 [Rhodospirillaceae bacterium]|nr:MAG: hypothetical protein EPO08_21405 [Rhodospirillaceae bacterium]
MTDLVERLRANAGEPWMTLGGKPFALEAATEIERLRTALDLARTALLNIERRSEEGRAAITKLIDEQTIRSKS